MKRIKIGWGISLIAISATMVVVSATHQYVSDKKEVLKMQEATETIVSKNKRASNFEKIDRSEYRTSNFQFLKNQSEPSSCELESLIENDRQLLEDYTIGMIEIPKFDIKLNILSYISYSTLMSGVATENLKTEFPTLYGCGMENSPLLFSRLFNEKGEIKLKNGDIMKLQKGSMTPIYYEVEHVEKIEKESQIRENNHGLDLVLKNFKNQQCYIIYFKNEMDH